MTEDSEQDSGSEPFPDLAAAFADKEPASDASGPSESSEDAPSPPAEKPRRVAKTLIFNVPTAEAIETYAAAAAAAAEQAAEAAAAVTNSEKDLEIAALAEAAEQQLRQQNAQKRAARRVAKTLIFSEINLESLQNAAEAASLQPDVSLVEKAEPIKAEPITKAPVTKASTGEKRLRKIAKTLQESDLGGFGDQSLHIPTPTSEPLLPEMPSEMPDYGRKDSPDKALEAPAAAEFKAKPKRQQFVAKTMLDHSILWDTVSKFEAKMEVRVAEQLLEKANEPVKPFIEIECKKKATPCSFVWDDPETKQRFKYCDLCRTPVYNFAGLEQPEADELIFQRENRRNATLYKRADGKYMTVNCPVEVKRKRDMIYMSIGGVALAVATIAFMILMPRPPKPEPTVVQTQQPASSSSSNNSNSASPNAVLTNTNYPNAATSTQPGVPTAGDGSFHMVNGQRVYPKNTGTAPVAFPAPVQAPATTTDADESGQFWQYDGPPPTK